MYLLYHLSNCTTNSNVHLTEAYVKEIRNYYVNEYHFWSTCQIFANGYQIRGLSSTKVIKCNFRLILCIILRSSIFFFLLRHHETSTFAWEREPNLSATQWYIYFSSCQIQPWVTAQSFWVYNNFSTNRPFIQESRKMGFKNNKRVHKNSFIYDISSGYKLMLKHVLFM